MRCSKCGKEISDDIIIVWKCNLCGKAFKGTKSQLQNLFMKKKLDPEKSFLKCPTCNNMDDGNESIFWKCSCGNINKGKLKEFDEETENTPRNNLVKCPQCGQEISSKAKRCVHCGKVFSQGQSNKTCSDCGKEIPEDAVECPYCGYHDKTLTNNNEMKHMNTIKSHESIKLALPIFAGIVIIAILYIVIRGYSKCEHEYDMGIITREPTCTEEGEKTFKCFLCGDTKIERITKKEHEYKEMVTKEPTFEEEGEKTFICEDCGDSFVEIISVLNNETYNKNIYEHMVEYYDNGDYINALIIARNAIRKTGKAETQIDEMLNAIFELHNEYIKEQLEYAFDNCNFEIIDTLYFYQILSYHTELVGKRLEEYNFVNRLQGLYKESDISSGNVQVEIEGYNIRIDGNEYKSDYVLVAPYEGNPNSISPRLVFEGGTVGRISNGLIAITYEDGTWIKLESDERAQQRQAQEQREEEKRQEYLANEPKIGMTAAEVRASNWGEPEKINKTTYAWGVTEQWCYPNNKYIYFDDGIVTAISE